MVETKGHNSTKGCKVRSPSPSHPAPVPHLPLPSLWPVCVLPERLCAQRSMVFCSHLYKTRISIIYSLPFPNKISSTHSFKTLSTDHWSDNFSLAQRKKKKSLSFCQTKESLPYIHRRELQLTVTDDKSTQGVLRIKCYIPRKNFTPLKPRNLRKGLHKCRHRYSKWLHL